MSDTSEPLARNSLVVARWTLVSRLTGFVRVVTIAAVLGPTYLGNTFQATNFLPNLIFELLTGSLIASLLVPALVPHIDSGNRGAEERIAGGFLGVVLAGFSAVALIGLLGGPLLVALLSATVADPETAEAQRRVGFILVALFMPQVVLYGLAGIGGAVMNAHGRFALPAAAPALENLGVIATMGAVALVFGAGRSIEETGILEVVVLGAGTTTAVALNAAAQLWGANRVGVRLRPRAGWREPELRGLIRRTVPSLGFAALNSGRTYATTVVANAVPGGVVAFNLAHHFFYLPTAMGARPVALALLPTLSRLRESDALERFRSEFVRGLALVAFLTVPAAVGYLVLSETLADAAAFGEMDTARGIALVAASLAALSPGVIGEGTFVMATNASYALRDARRPLISMALRTAVSLGGMGLALALTDDTALLIALGLAISAGDLAGAGHLSRHVERALPTSRQRLAPAVRRACGASAIMAAPAYLAAAAMAAALGGQLSSLVAMVVASVVGAATFTGVQRAWRSPELEFFLGGMRRREAGGP